MSIDVPEAIETHLEAHDRRDTDAAVAAFATDATVTDDGATYEGSERVRWWLDNAASEYQYTRTLLAVEDLGGGSYLVTNHLSGDFPGGEVDLRYRFDLRDGRIHRLVIERAAEAP